jgi:hypothetical protein
MLVLQQLRRSITAIAPTIRQKYLQARLEKRFIMLDKAEPKLQANGSVIKGAYRSSSAIRS